MDLQLTSPAVLKSLLRARGIRLSKRLGQNFLCSDSAVRRIVEATRIGGNALEIGAGVGTLTVPLARRARRLVAVEIDERLMPLLQDHVASIGNVRLIHSDILNVDLAQVASQLEGGFDVVGNLPYQVTSPVLDKLVRARAFIREAVLMVQREVAEKVLAPVGSGRGSALGVFLQAFAEVHKLFHLPKGAFFPPPQVDSTVFKLQFLPRARFRADEGTYFKVVRAAFNLRRKTVKQALIQSPFLGLPAAQAEMLLREAGIDPRRRGETLSLEEFDRLASAAGQRVERFGGLEF